MSPENLKAYRAAVEQCGREYDWRELSARNEVEGYGARRLADEYRDDFMALFCERWFSTPYLEIHRAALNDLQDRIGSEQFVRVAEEWKAEHLIRGVDY